MYYLGDIFLMIRYYLQYILALIPFVFIHILAMFSLRFLLLPKFTMLDLSRLPNVNYFERYVFFLLLAMLTISFTVFAYILLYDGVVFNLSNDFIFLAGVFLTVRKGVLLLLLGFLFELFQGYFHSKGVLWDTYLLLDTVIYFIMGIVSGNMLHASINNIGWSDIFFICANKIIAFLVSASCWFLLVQESWFSGFNLLLFRLVGWPLISLPVISYFLFLMKQDAHHFSAPSLSRV